MIIETLNKQPHTKGVIYYVKINGKIIKILFLSHAIERINKWKIKEEHVTETLIFPEEVLKGHGNRYIAHKRYNNHIIRAVYEYFDDLPILVTVYFPLAQRYFQGESLYEDKIFKVG